MLIRASDVRNCGFCMIPGVRDFCKKYDINFRDFCRNGIDHQVLLETKDSMAIQVVEKKYGRQ